MSKIEWTDITWNPTTGCEKVSRGCKFCYAEAMTKRLAAMGKEKYLGILTDKGRFNGKVRAHEAELARPFTWGKKPRMVFVNSMSDLFHADVPFEFIDKVFAVMALTPQHTYQILTKRPDRMAEYYDYCAVRMKLEKAMNATIEHHWPLPNVWIGTSVENQAAAYERIPHLLRCPAAVRFLSCEPLVGAVDLGEHIWLGRKDSFCGECGSGGRYMQSPCDHFCEFKKIHWVIAGGESGPNATPMHPDWPRMLRDQCEAAGVAFFFKQWGEFASLSNGHWPITHAMFPDGRIINWTSLDDDDAIKSLTHEDIRIIAAFSKVGKAKSGRLLDGRTYDGFPKSAIINHQSTIPAP